MNGKVCTKCRVWKEYKEFPTNKKMRDGRRSDCKECQKKYRESRKEHFKEMKKEYYLKNKDRIKKQTNEYKRNNKEKVSKRNKKYNKKSAKFDTFAHQLDWSQEVRRDPSNKELMQVRCKESGCNKWFNPTNLEVIRRLQAIKGQMEGDGNLYCSDQCKLRCIIYGQKLYPKNYEYDHRREVQRDLAKLVLERDEYKCQRCWSEYNLECHHFEGMHQNPIESADIDMCITLCRECHNKAHEDIGCRNVDLQRLPAC